MRFKHQTPRRDLTQVVMAVYDLAKRSRLPRVRRLKKAVWSPHLMKRRDQMERFMKLLIGHIVYIVFAREVDLNFNPGLGGFVSFGMSHVIEERMPERYHGEAAVIVVHNHDTNVLSPAQVAVQFDGTCFHELAHVVQGFDGTENGLCMEPAKHSDLERVVSTPPETWNFCKAGPIHGAVRWTGHDLQFIRTLLHLCYRAEQRGQLLCLNAAFDHESYGLSSADEYRKAIGDEPKRRLNQPIRSAITGPLPDEFQRLWSRDVLRSLNAPPTTEKEKCDAIQSA